ncbi:hypothetical protein [Azospirillum griseum]|uniref:Uncharacterized protein n=1 Tax=Azospirillum griseum TaxID=2496639 RepID=A0A3S0IDG4_9PROT|nr:hypothetical protein [Azospirillum griseum]RTR17799.1 hypothetical protein EJ903_16830 [Azospirillum griseum]
MPNAILKEAFAAVGGADEVLEEPFHGAALDFGALPPLTRRERWSLALARFGLTRVTPLLRDKLRVRRTLDELPARFGPSGAGLTHPTQLAPYLELLTALPEELWDEENRLESAIAALLIEYRFKHSVKRGLMCYYSKMAKVAFSDGHKRQKIVGKIDSPDELSQVLTNIREKYLIFIRNYVYAIVTREDVLKGKPLFLDLLTAVLFLSRIGEGGVLGKEPDGRRLPDRSDLLFIALRDPVLLKAAEDMTFQKTLSRSIKEFPVGEAA